MGFGGFHQFPLRFGGGPPTLMLVYDGINQALGTAYDTTDASNVTAETESEARLIHELWRVNERSQNAFDPIRMTDTLERWESILGLPRRFGATLAMRRAAVEAKLATLSEPTRENVYTVCETALGSAFVGVEYTAIPESTVRSPANGWDDWWWCDISHVLVRADNSALSSGVFKGLRDSLLGILYDFLPDYVTVDVGVYDSTSSRDFRLDEPDLDLETFSI